MLIKYIKLLPRTTINRYYATASATKQKPKNQQTQSNANSKSQPIIQCKRSHFNLLTPIDECKFGTLKLASDGWHHYKSKNDYFTINATQTMESIQTEMKAQEISKIDDISLNKILIDNLNELLDITYLTNIQAEALQKIYNKNHTLIAAETGCGKTLAYLLPMIQRILDHKENPKSMVHNRKLNTPLALVITPGRELASQISMVAQKLCKSTGIQVKTLLGGKTKRIMDNPNFDEIDILVASMGALSKLVTTAVYRVEQVRHVVLDEADTLLDDSFFDKLAHFLKKFPFHKNHLDSESVVGTQLILASATMPTNIKDLLQRIVSVDTLHPIVSPHLHRLMPHVEQKFLRMSKADRPGNLLSIVKSDLIKHRPLIIFSNKSATSDYLSIFLNNNNINCLNLNGDMLRKIRLGRFEQFQNGQCDVLSTTDIGSRGLDTQRARHVVNFDFPLHISDYIHRSGRIGRIGNTEKCLVTNFISSQREIDIVRQIEHTARIGGILPNVNANIKSLINKKIMKDMETAGLTPPNAQQELVENEHDNDDVFNLK